MYVPFCETIPSIFASVGLALLKSVNEAAVLRCLISWVAQSQLKNALGASSYKSQLESCEPMPAPFPALMVCKTENFCLISSLSSF